MISLILGASTGIGRKVAEQIAQNGGNTILVARNNRDIEYLSRDLTLRYNTKNYTYTCDLTNKEDAGNLLVYLKSFEEIGRIVITIGYVSSLDRGTQDENEIEKLLSINFSSIVRLISKLLPQIENNSKTTVAICSTVAVGRPRANNIIYASAKSAIDFFFRALQHKYADKSVTFQIYRLGYVDTAMSYGQKLLFPVASPERVARKIILGMNTNIRVKYIPSFWRLIVFLLRFVPWFIYKRLQF